MVDVRMRLEDFSELTIEELRQERVPEGWFYEYKSAPPKDGFGKSVAAFANTDGGWLIVGVEAEKTQNIITAIPGLPLTQLRQDAFTNQVLATVQPRPLFRTRIVTLANGNAVLICRVEPSLVSGAKRAPAR
jgi:predicted HTH transcriptional regulator